jgi:hypothetical protein
VRTTPYLQWLPSRVSSFLLIKKSKYSCCHYAPSDEQLVLADGEHPEEVEDEEVRASRLAMPLLQWLADQHHRKHHVPGTTAAPASSSVPAYGGDAGAVSRLVASALVRDWSALSLPALAALVRVLTTECASFLPAHAVRPLFIYLFIIFMFYTFYLKCNLAFF